VPLHAGHSMTSSATSGDQPAAQAVLDWPRTTSGLIGVVGFDCLVVAGARVRDLLLCAKHLFVAPFGAGLGKIDLRCSAACADGFLLGAEPALSFAAETIRQPVQASRLKQSLARHDRNSSLRPMTAAAMRTFSPALRVRRKFMRLGLLISALAFVVVGGDVLLEQWIEGYASALFIFGTVWLIAAACAVLFAIIAVIGLVTPRVCTDKS
jgi:hypothetical protein